MRIALVGYGRMGRALDALAPELGLHVAARIDRNEGLDPDRLAGVDVAIDFTLPEVAPDVLRRLAELGIDAVSGTTGWYDRLDDVRAAVERAGTGLVYAPNFSIGVALFRRMVRDAARLAAIEPDYDVHLHESHHRHKVDHPSGTAVAIADDLLEAHPRKVRWEEDPPAGERPPEVLGVSVSRHGSVPGTHVVQFDGPHDRIELRHEARSRDGFARGALEAARWIHGRPGVFTLDDLLDARLRDAHPDSSDASTT